MQLSAITIVWFGNYSICAIIISTRTLIIACTLQTKLHCHVGFPLIEVAIIIVLYANSFVVIWARDWNRTRQVYSSFQIHTEEGDFDCFIQYIMYLIFYFHMYQHTGKLFSFTIFSIAAPRVCRCARSRDDKISHTSEDNFTF